MASPEAAAKAGFSAIKSHWIFFLLLALAVVGLALSYDARNGGALRSKFASIPLVGRFFA